MFGFRVLHTTEEASYPSSRIIAVPARDSIAPCCMTEMARSSLDGHPDGGDKRFPYACQYHLRNLVPPIDAVGLVVDAGALESCSQVSLVSNSCNPY
jgi:hypothetical protein